MNNSYQIPELNNILLLEVQCILSIFKLYDLNGTGIIPPHHARKILGVLGKFISNSECI